MNDDGTLSAIDDRFSLITRCLLSFGPDPDANINRLVALLGETLAGAAAFYNRIEGEALHTLGAWRPPQDMPRIDTPAGHICTDVIARGGPNPVVVRDLQHSRWATSDPNVRRFNLATYLGIAVHWQGTPVGSLCVVYTTDVEPATADLEFLASLAMAVAVEEDRKGVLDRLAASECQARELASLMRLMCDNVPDLIWAKDVDQRYLFANRAMCEKLLGAVDTAEPLGRTDMFFAERERASHPDDPTWHTFGEMCRDSDTVVMASATAQRFDEAGNVRGRHLDLDVYKAPFLATGGTMIGTVGCGRDVTAETTAELERVAMEQRAHDSEEQLRQLQRVESLSVLAGGVAHDFNNLLQAIQGYTDLLSLKLEPTSSLQPLVQGIARAVTQASDLTRQMLAFSGRSRFVVEPADLGELVERAAKSLQEAAGGNIVRVIKSAAVSPIEADLGQLRQLLINLVTNAAEASSNPARAGNDPGGAGTSSGSTTAITVSTGVVGVETVDCLGPIAVGDVRPGRFAFLRVSDDGCGMDDATRARMFDPFYSTKFTGRGLGLAAVEGIVRAHQGFITVTSTPGNGTTVTVYFPFLEQPDEIAADAARAVVLLGDRDAAIVDDASASFRLDGFEFLRAADAASALRMIENDDNRVRMAIVDSTLARCGGCDALRSIHDGWPDLPIIVVAPHPPAATGDAASTAGRSGNGDNGAGPGGAYGHAADAARAGQPALGQLPTGGNGGRVAAPADESGAGNGKASAGHPRSTRLSSGSFTAVQLVSAVEHALGNSASAPTPNSRQ